MIHLDMSQTQSEWKLQVSYRFRGADEEQKEAQAFLGKAAMASMFIMFVILKIFFFPDILKKNFDSDEERSNYVLEQLTNP